MSSARIYLTKLYIKNFFITLLGLELFFLLIDFLQNQKSIPPSANLIVLYFYYQSFAALKVTLALSLIFSALWSFIYLIRSNELMAFESIGVPRKEVIKPFFWTSMAATMLYITLGFTKAGYYYDDARAILENKNAKERSRDLFFRYNNEFIYIKDLNQLSKVATDLQIIGVADENEVKYQIKAKTAIFENDKWSLKDASILLVDEQNTPHITRLHQPRLQTLEGFKPKILDNISQGGKGLNIADAINAIWLLKDQKISVDKIKASLFSALSLPFFAPFFIVILGYFTPIASRGFLQARFAAIWIFATLIGWGLLTTLSKLSFYGSAGSYVTLIAIFAIGGYALHLFGRIR